MIIIFIGESAKETEARRAMDVAPWSGFGRLFLLSLGWYFDCCHIFSALLLSLCCTADCVILTNPFWPRFSFLLSASERKSHSLTLSSFAHGKINFTNSESHNHTTNQTSPHPNPFRRQKFNTNLTQDIRHLLARTKRTLRTIYDLSKTEN